MWSTVCDLIELSPSRKERRMKEWVCREISTTTGYAENGILTREKELIRCKDCKHHHYEHHYEYKIPYCNLIDYGYGWEDNDFCSRAERKEE